MASNEETIVYSPPEIMQLSMQQLQAREKDPRAGVQMHVPALDEYMIPARPGDLIAIIGRPSNYKTGLMLWTLRKEAENIMRDIRNGDKNAINDIVVYVTWEIAIEEAGLLDLASATRIDVEAMARGQLNSDAWGKLREKAARRSGFPLWILGHSIERRKARPDLHMDAIVDACRWIEENMGKRVRVIGLDYLNQIPVKGRGPRREEVMDIVKDAKNMALMMGCPVILGVQAKREVDERKIPIPEMGDGMETSNIEHTADKIFTVWMPKVTHQQGDLIDVGGTALTVTDNMLVVKLAKQRYGKAGKLMFLHIDPATSTIQGAYTSVNIDQFSREVMDDKSKAQERQEIVQGQF